MRGPAPSFTLDATDPFVPFLLSIYSSMLVGDSHAASVKFAAMLGRVSMSHVCDPDVERSGAAIDCAMTMFQWRTANGDLCR